MTDWQPTSAEYLTPLERQRRKELEKQRLDEMREQTIQDLKNKGEDTVGIDQMLDDIDQQHED